MEGGKAAGQQIADGGLQFLAVQRGQRHRHVMLAEFGKLLAAAAAAGHRRGTVGDDINLDQFGLSGGHHGGDGARFGAGALGVGNILDVAARIDLTRGRADRRPHLELRIGRIGIFTHAPGGVGHGSG